MGREAICTAHHNGQSVAGKLRLETVDLRLSGALKLKVPLSSITSATAKDGVLHVVWPEGEARFELGAAAEKWARDITTPKSLLDKLGVKAGHNVGVLGFEAPEFIADLEAKGARVTAGEAGDAADIIFVRVEEPGELNVLQRLAESIAKDGAIWVVTPKKRPQIADTVVMAAGKEAGLVDVKVASFSDTHTALKFVIPRNLR